MKLSFVSVCRCLAAFCLVLSVSTEAAIVRVDVADNVFRPAVTNITAGDSVRWVWVGANQHSTTHSGSPRLWDSGLRGNGATYTNTFNNPGSFPYFCTVPLHAGQNGTIQVASANPPPTVAIQFPTNGTVYATPAIVRLTAIASDNVSVTNVQFVRNNVVLGNDSTSPYEGVDNNPATGTWAYGAIASDNLGDKTTNRVSVSVVTPVDTRLTNVVQLSPTQFRFNYSANPGLRYFVEKSADLGTWQKFGTNRAAGSSVTFTDDSATAGQGSYRVGRAPNP